MGRGDAFSEGYHQGRLFNPDNPPQAFSREEVDTNLEKVRADMRSWQSRRSGGAVKKTYLPKRLRTLEHRP